MGSDGTVACWGFNGSGQATPPTGTFTSVSAGLTHTCGVGSDGTVACWGNDLFGQLTSPTGTFTSVSAGLNHTCGRRSDGTVACWGSNGSGRANPFLTSPPPPDAPLGSPYSHQFAITHESPGPAFVLTAGSLLPGLALSGSGLLSGTTTTPGSFGATVCAGNNLAPLARQSFTLTVIKASPTIFTLASPGNLLGAPVRDVATLAGGVTPTGTVTFPGSDRATAARESRSTPSTSCELSAVAFPAGASSPIGFRSEPATPASPPSALGKGPAPPVRFPVGRRRPHK